MRLIALCSLFVVGACVSPKVLVDQSFTGSNRTTKPHIQTKSDATFATYLAVSTPLDTGAGGDRAAPRPGVPSAGLKTALGG